MECLPWGPHERPYGLGMEKPPGLLLERRQTQGCQYPLMAILETGQFSLMTWGGAGQGRLTFSCVWKINYRPGEEEQESLGREDSLQWHKDTQIMLYLRHCERTTLEREENQLGKADPDQEGNRGRGWCQAQVLD